MNADFFYSNVLGRFIMKAMMKTRAFKIPAAFLNSRASKRMITSYIRKNGIDMSEFDGQEFGSFHEFFARKKEISLPESGEKELISPCDSLLSVFPIDDGMNIPMKGSFYRLEDILPDPDAARLFTGGLCMVFRLEASDYHHFCAFDGMTQGKVSFVPGLLHSVQPIACESVPVYRLNRRWWSILQTDHFGTAAQIEVGAMIVGGVEHVGEGRRMSKGDEMGYFVLAGSTVLLLFGSDVRKRFSLYSAYSSAFEGNNEVRVKIGEAIGKIIND